MLQKKAILDGHELVLKDIISIWVQIEVVKSYMQQSELNFIVFD